MVRCHLDPRRICDGSCIAHDYKYGCKLKGNEYAPRTVKEYASGAYDLDLKEI
jgi:hypothetical protein